MLIDVRSAKDFAQAHIKGAISLPIESKPETLLKTLAPDCDKKIVIYCSQQLFPTRMVALSSMGTAQLEAMGYTDVAQLELLWDSQSLNGSLEPDSSSGGPSFEIEGNDTAKSPLKRYAKKPKS